MQFGEVAIERTQIAALDEQVVAASAEHDGAKPVPLGLVEQIALGQVGRRASRASVQREARLAGTSASSQEGSAFQARPGTPAAAAAKAALAAGRNNDHGYFEPDSCGQARDRGHDAADCARHVPRARCVLGTAHGRVELKIANREARNSNCGLRSNQTSRDSRRVRWRYW